MSRRLSIVLVCLAGVIPDLAAWQQPQTPAPAVILGRVVDGVSGDPLSGAIVTIAPAATPGSVPAPPAETRAPIAGPTRVLTDGDGRFVFYGLPAGAFTIGATKSGYISGGYGRRPQATPALPRPTLLVLTAGQARGDVTIPLWKYGVISGRVVDEHGEPMIGVQVRVLRRSFVAGRPRFTQTGNMPATDDRGVYRISTLEPGDYVAAIVSTHATMPASLFDSYMTAVRGGDSLGFSRTLEAGGATIIRNGVRIGSLIVGSGSNAPGTNLRNTPPALPPGSTGRPAVYPTNFYPAASTPAQASVITVNAGEERGNIDFQLRPVTASTMSGTLTGPEGPLAHTAVVLLPAGIEQFPRDDSFETGTSITDSSGAFMFVGVTPGQYTLRAVRVPVRPVRPSTGSTTIIQAGSTTISSSVGGTSAPEPIPDGPTWWASMPVAVGNADVTGLTLTARTGARIRGRVQFDGAGTPPTPEQLERMSVTIEPSDGRSSTAFGTFQTRMARFDSTGVMNSYQLAPGSYILRAGVAAPGWTFVSATLDGKDVSVQPFVLEESDVEVVIKLTDRPSELSGAITSDAKYDDVDLLVVVFPVDPGGWTDYGAIPRRLQSSGHKGAGTFSFRALPGGEYYVAAIRQDVARDWRDPAFLKKLAAIATRATVTQGQTSTVSVRPVEVR